VPIFLAVPSCTQLLKGLFLQSRRIPITTTTSQVVKLDARTRERLQALAKQRDRSPHYLMKTAIESFLDREEFYAREK